jgi:hypothetical protein
MVSYLDRRQRCSRTAYRSLSATTFETSSWGLVTRWLLKRRSPSVYADAGGLESAGKKEAGVVKWKTTAIVRMNEDSEGYCWLGKSVRGLCRP